MENFNMLKTAAAIKIQRLIRLVIRKKKFAIYMKQTASAILIQAHIRRYLAESKFNVRITKSGQRFISRLVHLRKYDKVRAPLDHILSIFMKYWKEQNEENVKVGKMFFHMIFFPDTETNRKISTVAGHTESKKSAGSKHGQASKTEEGGITPTIKPEKKGRSSSRSFNNLSEEEEELKTIEDMKVDLDLFIKMMKHCTKKLLTTSEIVNIYHETCKQISKDTTFGIKEWEKVILHFGITIPIDNESGNIIKMGEGGEETNL